jgi:hypothetical protein
MAFQRNHILKSTGSKAPGVKPEFFFAPGDWFDTIAEPDDDDDEDGTGNSVIITDSHTFLDPSPDPAYGFIKLQIADRTGKITIDQNRNAVKPAVVLKVEKGEFKYQTTHKTIHWF